MTPHNYINSNINVIAVFDLVDYDYNFGLFYEHLKILKRDHFGPLDKIVILHNDTEYFYQRNNIGFTLYNVLTCWKDLDIPYHVMVIYSNHSNLESSIEPFIVHQKDRPVVIPTVVNNRSWNGILDVPTFEISKKIKHSAFCLLGAERQHRIKFFQYLLKYNLFDYIKVNYKSNFYQSSKKSIDDNKKKNVVHQTDKISNLIYTFPHRINETCFSQSRYSDIVDLNLFTPCPRHDLTGEVSDFYNDFFLEVVSETVFDYPHVFVSEKTLKPLLFKTPFIVFGAQGTLEYLKKNGFKTFDNFWDESYDSESDPHLRFLKCCEVVRNNVIKPIEELKSIYQEMIPILEHNRACLLEYVETVYKTLYNKINL